MMEPIQFCYWIQGFAEINGGKPPTEEQWKIIRDHLNTVFKKVTPVSNHRDLTTSAKSIWNEESTSPVIAKC